MSSNCHFLITKWVQNYRISPDHVNTPGFHFPSVAAAVHVGGDRMRWYELLEWELPEPPLPPSLRALVKGSVVHEQFWQVRLVREHIDHLRAIVQQRLHSHTGGMVECLDRQAAW